MRMYVCMYTDRVISPLLHSAVIWKAELIFTLTLSVRRVGGRSLFASVEHLWAFMDTILGPKATAVRQQACHDIPMVTVQRPVKSMPKKLLQYLADTGNAWLLLLLKCYFTSTETVGLLGTGAQDVHLDFHTTPEVCARLSVEDVLQCPGLAHVSIVVCHQLQCLCFWSLAKSLLKQMLKFFLNIS